MQLDRVCTLNLTPCTNFYIPETSLVKLGVGEESAWSLGDPTSLAVDSSFACSEVMDSFGTTGAASSMAIQAGIYINYVCAKTTYLPYLI